MGFPGGSDIKESALVQEIWVRSLDQEDPLEQGMATHPSILAWRIQGHRSPAGYSPWGRRESDMTESLTLSCSNVTSSQPITSAMISFPRKITF